MLGSTGVVDAVARAQIIEPVGSRRMLAARQQQGVDQALARDQILACTLQLAVQKAEIEGRVVGDQGGIPEEGQQLLGDLGKGRLVLEKLG